MLENDAHDFLWLIDNLHQIHVAGADDFLGHQHVLHPFKQATPEVAATQNNRNAFDFARLHQGKALKQFVQSADASWHAHKGNRVFHKHHFAREKMLEFNRQILIRVGALLVRQHNIQPHRRAGAGKRALKQANFLQPKPKAVVLTGSFDRIVFDY